MKRLNIILLILYGLIVIFFLCGCSSNEKDNTLEEKINSEVQYLDKKIIGIMNKLNNITLENYEVKSKEISLQEKEESSQNQSKSEENSNSNESSENKQSSSESSNSIKVLQMQPNNILLIDKNDIDWVTIKSEIEVMYSSWDSILIDLYEISVDNKDILNFSEALNNTVLMAKEENKSETLVALANLYSYLPKYIDKLTIDGNKKNILQVKSNILNAYALLEEDNWTEVQNQINLADELYTEIINDVKYIEDNQEEASKTYVLIKELKNSIDVQDKDIFYIKYKNLMNSIQ